MSIEGSLDLFAEQEYGRKLLGVLLGIVILLFGFLDYKTGGNIVNILEKNKKLSLKMSHSPFF